MRLTNGTLFPMPVTLDLPQNQVFNTNLTIKFQVEKFSIEQRIALQDTEGNLIAVMTIETIYKPDKDHEAKCVFGSNDEVSYNKSSPYQRLTLVFNTSNTKPTTGTSVANSKVTNFLLTTTMFTFEVKQLHSKHNSHSIESPTELRQFFNEKGWDRIVGFQTRNPLHRSHFELTQRAAKSANCHLLLHPTVGTYR